MHSALKSEKSAIWGKSHCLPQRLKSKFFFQIFFLSRWFLKGTWTEEIFSNSVDFSLWGNRVTNKSVFGVWVVSRLPQRLKSTFFEFFSSLQVSFAGTIHSKKKLKNNIDFYLWGKQYIVSWQKWTFFPHFSTVCGGSLKVDLPRRKTNYRVQLASSAAQSQISCTLGPRKQAERNWFHISCSVHATNFLPYLLPWFLFFSIF